MHKNGHIGLGILLTSPLLYYLIAIQHQFLIGIAVILLVSVLAPLPDMDLYVPTLKHRGMTHTIWYALGVGVVISTVTWFGGLTFINSSSIHTTAFMGVISTLSILSHILGDWFTPMGVAPLKPLRSEFKSVNIVKSDNSKVNGGLFVSGWVMSVAVFIIAL